MIRVVITLNEVAYATLLKDLDDIRRLSNITNGEKPSDYGNLTKIATNVSRIKKELTKVE